MNFNYVVIFIGKKTSFNFYKIMTVNFWKNNINQKILFKEINRRSLVFSIWDTFSTI